MTNSSVSVPPPLEEEIEDPVAELEAIEAELTRREYLRDPVKWVEEKLGETLWSVQKEILKAIASHRKVLIRSCHDVGKSFIVSRAIGWWIDTSPVGDAFVVTSAPSAPQVRAILWREIGRVHAKGKLKGRLNQTEWLAEPANGGKEEQVAFGRKPDDMNPDAFQGIHAPRVLVVFDEGNGIRGGLWEAADSLIANEDSKMVVIGNPDDPAGEFFENSKPGSGWHVIEIGAFESPNLSGEEMPLDVKKQLISRLYIEDKRRKWAPNWYWVDDDGNPSDYVNGRTCICPKDVDPTDTNPYWQSKILGKFPEHSTDGGLIPISWIIAAQQRTLKPIGPNELGQDVGGGGDASVVAHRRGPVVRIINENHNPDTMQTAGNLIHLLKTTGARKAKVDTVGIGQGIVDRCKEQQVPVVGINVGTSARDGDQYANLRAEGYWGLRTLFEEGLIDIDENDIDLASELVEIRYKRTSSGKIQIESKLDMKKRGYPSPNRSDAVMLSFIDPPLEEVICTSATWGRGRW